jgi:hypothetical protein
LPSSAWPSLHFNRSGVDSQVSVERCVDCLLCVATNFCCGSRLRENSRPTLRTFGSARMMCQKLRSMGRTGLKSAVQDSARRNVMRFHTAWLIRALASSQKQNVVSLNGTYYRYCGVTPTWCPLGDPRSRRVGTATLRSRAATIAEPHNRMRPLGLSEAQRPTAAAASFSSVVSCSAGRAARAAR